MEELLAYTINTAHAMKAVDARELSRVIVDTTVQEKAIAHPTDSRLLEVARKKLVLLAKRHGIALRQSDAQQGPALSRKAGHHAHARQFKRMRKVLRRQRTILGRVLRDLQRKLAQLEPSVRERIGVWLEHAHRLLTQRPKDKQKLYALHAPEVECIRKGKAGSPYEFGVKERRQAVEPVIGHLKQDCRLNRCHLKGAQGDALHVLGCAAGYNLRWLLRWIAFLRAWLQVVRARSSTSSSTMWPANMALEV